MGRGDTVEKPHAPTVARALMVNVFSRFGTPLQLLSDRGPEFKSDLFRELCRWMEIDKVRTTAYPQSNNGMVERYHRTLNSILGKIMREDQRNWCEKVPIATAAYRASVHEATGYTPNRLLLNREVFAPLDIVAGPPPRDADLYQSTDDFVAQQQQMMRDVYTSVREHLQIAASRRKRYCDMRVKDRDFQPGMSVWYYYSRRYARKSPKWHKTYIGPYLITKVLPPSNTVLQKTRRSRAFVVHFDKLKLSTGATPNHWRLVTVHEGTAPGPDDAAADPHATETSDVQFERNSTTGSGVQKTEHGDCHGETDSGTDLISAPRDVSSEPLDDTPGCIGRQHRIRRRRRPPKHLDDYCLH